MAPRSSTMPPSRRAVAGQAVGTAADGQLESRLAGERDGPRNIDGGCRLDDEQRVQVDLGVVDLAGEVVALVLGADDRAADAGGEGREVVRGGGVEVGDTGEGHRTSFRVVWSAGALGVTRWSSPTWLDTAGKGRPEAAVG